MAKIIAPNKSFSGVSCGVSFIEGVGVSDSERALAYFTSMNYTILEDDEEYIEPVVPTIEEEFTSVDDESDELIDIPEHLQNLDRAQILELCKEYDVKTSRRSELKILAELATKMA